MQDRNVDIQEGTRLRSVRRRLFQDDDEDTKRERGVNPGVDDNLVNCFFEEARRNRENAKERWNFDFEKEEPLPGQYEWVKLDQDGNEITDSERSNSTVENSEEVVKEEPPNGLTEIRYIKEDNDSNNGDST